MNKLLSLVVKMLSVLSVFFMGKLDVAHVESASVGSQEENGRSNAKFDLAYANIADIGIDEQWGGGGPHPVQE